MKGNRVKGFFKKFYLYRVFLVMLLPAVLYTLIFSYYPMTGIVLAFKKYNYNGGIWGSPWNGLENFEFFFSSGQAGLVTRNTVLYNIVFIILNAVVQIAVAILLTELTSKVYRKVTQSLMFLPYFISWVIVGIMAFNIFSSDYGFMNNIITALGGEKVLFYTTPEIWPFIIVFFNLWKNIGYGSVMYLAAIMGIDTSIYEAATIDGANFWQRFRHVTVPFIAPAFTYCIPLWLAAGLRQYDYSFVATNGGPGHASESVAFYIYNYLFPYNKVGYGQTVALVYLVVCILISNLVTRALRKREIEL